MDHIAIAAVVLSGIIIFTTIQSQDFADVAGDVAIGRVTFPIYAPEASRMVTLVALVLWSVLLADLWKLGTFSGGVFCALGVYVGYRYYNLRSVKEDKESYRMYNVSTIYSRAAILRNCSDQYDSCGCFWFMFCPLKAAGQY